MRLANFRDLNDSKVYLLSFSKHENQNPEVYELQKTIDSCVPIGIFRIKFDNRFSVVNDYRDSIHDYLFWNIHGLINEIN
jgi:hypothetical protein